MSPRRDWGRMLVAGSAALVLAAALFALVGPTGTEATTPAGPVGEEPVAGDTSERRTSTWGRIRAGEEDWFVALALALPVAVALAALVLEWTPRRRASRVAAAVVLGAFAVVGAASVGAFFLPGAALMGAAALVPPPRTR